MCKFDLNNCVNIHSIQDAALFSSGRVKHMLTQPSTPTLNNAVHSVNTILPAQTLEGAVHWPLSGTLPSRLHPQPSGHLPPTKTQPPGMGNLLLHLHTGFPTLTICCSTYVLSPSLSKTHVLIIKNLGFQDNVSTMCFRAYFRKVKF